VHVAFSFLCAAHHVLVSSRPGVALLCKPLQVWLRRSFQPRAPKVKSLLVLAASVPRVSLSKASLNHKVQASCKLQ
jgi:hypothetical protein